MSNCKSKPDMKRRDFISKTVLAASAVTVAPGVLLATVKKGSKGMAASSDTRWGMLIDTNKCADGCTSCISACEKENGIDLVKKPEGHDDALWDQQRPQWIRKVKLRDKQSGNITNLPLMCQHCEHPPCVDVCPTGASFKRADGIVMVDRHICIGCRYCMMACPYKARSFIHADVAEQVVQSPRGKGCVESCNLCANRLDAGHDNIACAEECAKQGHNAIVFGDLKDPNSAVSKALKKLPSRELREELKLNTGVRYTNV